MSPRGRSWRALVSGGYSLKTLMSGLGSPDGKVHSQCRARSWSELSAVPQIWAALDELQGELPRSYFGDGQAGYTLPQPPYRQRGDA